MKRFKNFTNKVLRSLVNLSFFINRKLFQNVFYHYIKYIGIDIKGKQTYISKDIYFDSVDYSKIHIGEKVVISLGVVILTHDYSISRGLELINGTLEREVSYVDDVYIGRNCFIGARVTILPGTIIGDNCIIGAGSVVKGEIPNDCIVAGNPAKLIGNIKSYTEKITKKSEKLFYDV